MIQKQCKGKEWIIYFVYILDILYNSQVDILCVNKQVGSQMRTMGKIYHNILSTWATRSHHPFSHPATNAGPHAQHAKSISCPGHAHNLASLLFLVGHSSARNHRQHSSHLKNDTHALEALGPQLVSRTERNKATHKSKSCGCDTYTMRREGRSVG